MIPKQGDGIKASSKHGLTTPLSWTPRPKGHPAPASMSPELQVPALPWARRASDQRARRASDQSTPVAVLLVQGDLVCLVSHQPFLHLIHTLFLSQPCISLALCDLDLTLLFFLPTPSAFTSLWCLIKKDRETKHQPQHPRMGGCWDTHTPTTKMILGSSALYLDSIFLSNTSVSRKCERTVTTGMDGGITGVTQIHIDN